jgi:tellurite methyltransferase
MTLQDGTTFSDAVPLDLKGWDTRFRQSGDEWFLGREPSELARLTANYWKILHADRTPKVLDLGSGEGRDAVHFTRKGFTVVAVDGSPVGIEKTRRLAQECHVEVAELHLSDVRNFPIAPGCDILFSNNCLQFLGSECLRYLGKLQSVTPPGGLNAVSVFTQEAQRYLEEPEIYTFERNELKSHYEGWRLLYYGEEILWREPAQAYLSFAKVIAQRTGEAPSTLAERPSGR